MERIIDMSLSGCNCGVAITGSFCTFDKVKTTAAGLQHLKAIQDMALDPTLDFTNPATNPLGHAWTTEERRVVTAIQTKNMAKSVNALYENRKAAGSRNPAQDVDDFVNRMS